MQDYYTLDNKKIDLIECYDHQRYTPSRIKAELTRHGIEPGQYEIIKAYAIYYANNYLEFISKTENKKRQAVKLAIYQEVKRHG